MAVFIGSHSHKFSAILFDSGLLLWETTLRNRIKSSACITLCEEFVVGCYDFNLYAVNSMNGDIWWKCQTGGEMKSSPVVDPVTSLVIFGSHDQCLYAVDVKTWTYTVEDLVFSSPIVVDDVILVGSNDCHLYCLSMERCLKWKVKVESAVYSSAFTFTLSYFQQDHDIINFKPKDSQNNMYFLSNCSPPNFSKPEVISCKSHSCNSFEADQSNELKIDTLKAGTIQKNGKVKKFVTFASTD